MRVISLSQLSLVGGSNIAEVKQPIWWADGATVSLSASATGATQSGYNLLADGTSSWGTSQTSSNVALCTLSSNWPSAIQFAFESTYGGNTTSQMYAALWDITSNTIVSSSQLTTTSASIGVLRSGKFTLTPTHKYGVTVWLPNTSAGNLSMVDASLIIFP